MMYINIKEHIKIIGLSIMLGCTFVLMLTFFMAFASPDKSILVTINTYGEANLEFIMLLFAIPIILIANYLIIKKR